MKIKPGDRVVLIDDADLDAMPGATATILEVVEENIVEVSWDRNDYAPNMANGWFCTKRFKLEEPTQRVVLSEPSDNSIKWD